MSCLCMNTPEVDLQLYFTAGTYASRYLVSGQAYRHYNKDHSKFTMLASLTVESFADSARCPWPLFCNNEHPQLCHDILAM